MIFKPVFLSFISLTALTACSGDKNNNNEQQSAISSSESSNKEQSIISEPKECGYLKSVGIETKHYSSEEDLEKANADKLGIPYEKDQNAEYTCNTDYIAVGDNQNNQLAYYAYGTSNKVKRVVLTIGINDMADESVSLNKYADYASMLYKKSTGSNLNKKYISKITNHQPFEFKVKKFLVTLEENESNSQNYGLSFEIKKL